MIDTTQKLFRWGPLDAALLPLSYTLVTSFDMMHELFGICWPESLVIFDGDKALWILESDKVAKTSNEFTEKIILNDDEERKFYDLWQQRIDSLRNIQLKINETDLSKLDESEIGNLFSSWSKTYLEFWAIGMTAEFINYGLESKLKNILCSKFSDERDINESFADLSTPDRFSFYKQEEIDLMRIALIDPEKRSDKFKEHQQKYFWIYNNYLESKELDLSYFEDQIKHTTVADAEDFLAEFKDYENKVVVAKNELFDKLAFSDNEIELVRLLNNSIIFQDDRKKYNLIATYYLEKFLGEFSQRSNISIRDLKWLLPSEIEKVAYGDDLKDLIEQRKNITTILCNLGSIKIETRNLASKTQKLFDSAKFEKSANLQGTVASTSSNRYFRGIARIILSPKDGDQLKPGEVLVTTMTTPDFVVFMKRAGAVITDVGGVTCHAAIVSREFGIPCIVGTENATKSIKDGDILELHNLRGTVKIVSAN